MGWVHGGGTPSACWPRCWPPGSTPISAAAITCRSRSSGRSSTGCAQMFGFPDTAQRPFRHRHVDGESDGGAGGADVRARDSRCASAASATSGTRLTAYTSTAAHGCIAQAMDLSGLGSDALRMHRGRRSHRIDVAALRDADRARSRGRADAVPGGRHRPAPSIPARSTISRRCARCAASEKLWFHVDGAFGALAILAPAIWRRGSPASSSADSIALDFHKWGQVPYDAGFLLVRDGDLHRDTFAAPAAYLRRETRGLAAGSPWPCDLGPDLSRGFRALKTWFTLKTYGTEKLGAVIARTCALAAIWKRGSWPSRGSSCWRRFSSTSSASAIAPPTPTRSMATSSSTFRSPGSPRRRRRCSMAGSRSARRSSITAPTSAISMR